ncbi:hypothetical protein [Fluviispira multicolorata]|uniref:Uncharacterized protein n=1 Tax=Fluviispira multicolorata TaxID=2654512 RepID=A0A833JD48_9BACT|nr:hypothetical protein [Fluviispira multicolorata]KAB8031081.1 hypothetical protein GCL57_08935 [Fluviispira multicolorata]
MNLWLVIKSVIVFLEQQWFVLVRQIEIKLLLLLLAQTHFAAFAQLSVLDKAESFFYNKEYENSSELYNNILKNEYSSKKDVAVAKCRIALININEKDFMQSQIYLEEALSENILSLPMTSICSYGLLQIYIKFQKYALAVSLVKVLEFPNLQPTYLAKYYALAAEAARFSLNKEFEKLQLKKLKDLMKKQNYQYISLNKEETKKISLFDIESRLSVLNFDENISSEFSNDYVANVFISKMKEGDHSTALEILEKKSSQNAESITFDSGINIKNSLLRSRLVQLLHDNPQEMRIGVILANGEKKQQYNQNFLRGISSFLSSTATNGVNYKIYIEETKNDGGHLSSKAFDHIFKNYVHALIIGDGFYNNEDLKKLSRLFSIPIIFPNDNKINNKDISSLSSELKEMNSIKMVSENGKFKNYFESSLQEKIQNLSIESKVFDSLILIRNMQFLANGSQSAELEKIMHETNWKINGIAIYENYNSLK